MEDQQLQQGQRGASYLVPCSLVRCVSRRMVVTASQAWMLRSAKTTCSAACHGMRWSVRRAQPLQRVERAGSDQVTSVQICSLAKVLRWPFRAWRCGLFSAYGVATVPLCRPGPLSVRHSFYVDLCQAFIRQYIGPQHQPQHASTWPTTLLSLMPFASWGCLSVHLQGFRNMAPLCRPAARRDPYHWGDTTQNADIARWTAG